ncbi:MAG: hypothetical protein ACRDHX_13235 [Chloroflexota bacterium]
MAEDTVTIRLDGNVPLDVFAVAVRHFNDLVSALTSEIAPSARISWPLADLQTGSALIAARGVAARPENADRVERVVRAFALVGKALEDGRPIPYSLKVSEPASNIVRLLDGAISAVRFETASDDATVVSPLGPNVRAMPRVLRAFGAVEGRVQTLMSRAGLRFTLFDSLHDRAVSCYLHEDQAEIMRGAWGRWARVHGWVSRDEANGRPFAIREIKKVEVLQDWEPGSYRRALGVLPYDPKLPLPEERLRKLRDG